MNKFIKMGLCLVSEVSETEVIFHEQYTDSLLEVDELEASTGLQLWSPIVKLVLPNGVETTILDFDFNRSNVSSNFDDDHLVCHKVSKEKLVDVMAYYAIKEYKKNNEVDHYNLQPLMDSTRVSLRTLEYSNEDEPTVTFVLQLD